MSERRLLTIGYVPKDCSSDRIVCGDSASSGTLEANIVIEDDQVSCLENDTVVEMEGDAWFDETHPNWKTLIAAHCTPLLNERQLDPKLLAQCWAIFHDEQSAGKTISFVAGEDDGGEFSNEDRRANGHFYVRFVYEEDGECFNEQVLRIHS